MKTVEQIHIRGTKAKNITSCDNAFVTNVLVDLSGLSDVPRKARWQKGNFDDDIVPMTIEERITRIQAFVFNVERLLGAEKGSLQSVIQMFSKE